MGEAFLDPPDHLGESRACSEWITSPFFFEDPSKRRIRPGPTATAAPALERAFPLAKILHFPLFFQCFLNFFLYFGLLACCWPPRRPQDPPRRLEDPPRRLQEPPRYPQDPPTGGQKTLIFLVFFKVFAFVGLLGAILAQHGLQDDVKSLQNAFKGLQDASKSLQDGSTSLQNAPKSLQDAPKTPPESSQNRAFHNVFKYIPLSWAFLEPSCSTWPSKRLQSPPKRLQDPPESLQDTPTCLQLRASRPLPRAGPQWPPA